MMAITVVLCIAVIASLLVLGNVILDQAAARLGSMFYRIMGASSDKELMKVASKGTDRRNWIWLVIIWSTATAWIIYLSVW